MALVYIETTIPSYLAARPARDLPQAARQQLTHDWWSDERHKFELCVSPLVLVEAARGDPEVAKRRLQFLANLRVLPIPAAVDDLVRTIMKSGVLAPNALDDAVHIAICSTQNVDFLLTWNLRHIANAVVQKIVAGNRPANRVYAAHDLHARAVM